MFECEICRVHNGLTIVQVIPSHEYCWFHCYSHKHSPNHRMFFSFSVTFEMFLSFSHLIIHPIHEWSWFYWQFNSASSFPMTICWGHASSWESISGRSDLSRGVSSFITDCAVPSWRVSSWEKPGPNFSCRSPRSFIRSPRSLVCLKSVFHSWEDQARSSSHNE